MWCSKAVTLKGVPAAWSALLSTWRVYSPSQVANSPCSLSADADSGVRQLKCHFAVCHQDAIRYTWFGVYLVIPLLKDQERVLVAMTSLKLNLQASKSVRDRVVKDPHVHLQGGPASPAVLSQVLSCFSTHSCVRIVEAKFAASSPCCALLTYVTYHLTRHRHCLPSQPVRFTIFSCIDKAARAACEMMT